MFKTACQPNNIFGIKLNEKCGDAEISVKDSAGIVLFDYFLQGLRNRRRKMWTIIEEVLKGCIHWNPLVITGNLSACIYPRYCLRGSGYLGNLTVGYQQNTGDRYFSLWSWFHRIISCSIAGHYVLCTCICNAVSRPDMFIEGGGGQLGT